MQGKVQFTQKKAGVVLCMVLLVLAQQVSGAPGLSKGPKSVEMIEPKSWAEIQASIR